jgi:putative ABC transport system permease protein
MRIPLAWLNLVHNKTRTALAVAGVAFAVILIFLQLGFLGAAEYSARMVFDAFDFDLLIRSCHYQHLIASWTFPRERLDEARSTPGVERVTPIYVGLTYWRNPLSGAERGMFLIGVNPADHVFCVPEIQDKLPLLTVPEFVLIDQKSREQFGPQNGRRFGEADIGVETELLQQRVRIAGCFSLGMGFVADGASLTSVRGFQRIRRGQAPDNVSLALVKLRPDADAEQVAAALRERLPDDVEVITRPAVLAREVRHWVWETSIGLIFQLGVAVAMVVGVAIVYQVLSSDVANHLPEYATLKAMGYGGGYLALVVLQQAVALALMGFLPGWIISIGLYKMTQAAARLPMELPASRVLFVLGLTVAMCTVSGLGALRKVRTADPADLF